MVAGLCCVDFSPAVRWRRTAALRWASNGRNYASKPDRVSFRNQELVLLHSWAVQVIKRHSQWVDCYANLSPGANESCYVHIYILYLERSTWSFNKLVQTLHVYQRPPSCFVRQSVSSGGVVVPWRSTLQLRAVSKNMHLLQFCWRWRGVICCPTMHHATTEKKTFDFLPLAISWSDLFAIDRARWEPMMSSRFDHRKTALDAFGSASCCTPLLGGRIGRLFGTWLCRVAYFNAHTLDVFWNDFFHQNPVFAFPSIDFKEVNLKQVPWQSLQSRFGSECSRNSSTTHFKTNICTRDGNKTWFRWF